MSVKKENASVNSNADAENAGVDTSTKIVIGNKIRPGVDRAYCYWIYILSVTLL
ncbi:hypothetical protein J6TS1_42830 [Siminovitchia terrae]|uniref:Uncharacterized protein n=1 Tax=Siminovitchia terrae TaxID=1914933 RepID=A0ABQ4L2B1_SIMTE|nr:hypothetical protein J6TS1_42830 [Siminovitchia terrae]